MPSSKSVRFTENLISDVRYRPKTLPEDLRTLFYTYEETQRFRQEYRIERRITERMEEGREVTSEMTSSVTTPEPFDSPLVEDEYQQVMEQGGNQLLHIVGVDTIEASREEQFNDDLTSCRLCGNHSKCKYDISRVVVMHNDTLKTYDDSELHVRNVDTFQNGNKKLKTTNEDFFDNDSFWS